MNVKEIIEKYLKENGYDGLYEDDYCGCGLENLAPCDSPGIHCYAGVKILKNSGQCKSKNCRGKGYCEGYCVTERKSL